MIMGTGTKIKVLEAIQHGKPVVTTLQGLQGQVNKLNNGILATDIPENFIYSVKALLDDQEYYKNQKY